jgi:hypothetical protein
MKIDGHSLERGIELYQKGIDKFLGNFLLKRLETAEFNTNEDLRRKLAADKSHGKGEWFDLAGLFVPGREIDRLLDDIETGKIKSIASLSGLFEKIHKSYYDWAWTWAADTIEKEEKKPLNNFNSGDVIRIIERWKQSVTSLDDLLFEDARKEYSLSSMTGFGADGKDEDKKLDFKQVRGDFESDRLVNSIREHSRIKSALGDELIERMKKIV